MKIKIFILAGESSGDLLGQGLINELQNITKREIEIEGVCGPMMRKAGCREIFSIDELSLIGFVEPFKKIFTLLKIRKEIESHLEKNRPHLFIGIDFPGFNLHMENRIKKLNIPIVHYVSPTIWAWRKYRKKKIERVVDLILLLFPFEKKLYSSKIMAKFIGHPMADEIPLKIDKRSACKKLNIKKSLPTLAIMPGSRKGEIKRLIIPFLESARLCKQSLPNLQIIIGSNNQKHFDQVNRYLLKYPDLQAKNHLNLTRDILMASDVGLLKSGTITLEALLCKLPMVVAYKLSFINFTIAKILINIPYFSLPNIISSEKLVEEFSQKGVHPKNLATSILNLLQNKEKIKDLKSEFNKIHIKLRKNASKLAARAILKLISSRENLDG